MSTICLWFQVYSVPSFSDSWFSPCWALICGRTFWSNSKDFLWYSAWTSISWTERQKHVNDKKAGCSSEWVKHSPSGSSLHSQFLWPRNYTCLPRADPEKHRHDASMLHVYNMHYEYGAVWHLSVCMK